VANLKITLLAGAMVLASPLAMAADIPMEPAPIPAPVVFGGWYLRGDLGFSNQEVDELDNIDMPASTTSPSPSRTSIPRPLAALASATSSTSGSAST